MSELVNRIHAEAATAARPGQLATLEDIAYEVEALERKLDEARTGLRNYKRLNEENLEYARELEAKLDDVRMRALKHMSLGNHMRPQEVLEAVDDSYQERLTRALDDMEEDR